MTAPLPPGHTRAAPSKTPGRDAPACLPLLVTGSLGRHAVVCNGCGSLVLNNPNAVAAHGDWHRSLDGDGP